ncbi:DUF6284 family protein [Kribbella sp. NPDC026611]|uniref:DUF6284 family protein n=1 Tax=Kribbella sp. NPDC026611 TaxID=3154911 RepID=UPI0033E78A19
MSIIHLSAVASQEPSAADLAVIEQEWPLIEAELDLLNAEISVFNAGAAMSALDRRRVRRAERRVMTVKRRLACLAGAPTSPCGCHGSVVRSTLRNGGEMCGRCGSTWDRHDRITTFYDFGGTEDLTGAGGAA